MCFRLVLNAMFPSVPTKSRPAVPNDTGDLDVRRPYNPNAKKTLRPKFTALALPGTSPNPRC